MCKQRQDPATNHIQYREVSPNQAKKSKATCTQRWKYVYAHNSASSRRSRYRDGAVFAHDRATSHTHEHFNSCGCRQRAGIDEQDY